ncbi:N-terminal acetyltransferase [Cadophora gregata f. sp. sojae]|nr:N-terminal acetyltransferase [Cadophora gregata f. sp. sojae]
MASAYTPDQLTLYEQHVSLPSHFHHMHNPPPPLNISYLTVLHIHQISSCPYENLQLHYSASHAVSLDPQVLFKKIVTDKRGRGGYCMENAIFFHHVLRGLGFKVYLAGVRIRLREGGVPKGNYVGWVHIINIVTLPTGSKYMLDVSFGGDGPTLPLPLISGLTHTNLGTQEIRLLHSTIPQQLDQSKLLWIYQYRNSPMQEWNSFYAFPETEFTEEDFKVMNHWTSTSMAKTNFQTRRVLVVRFLRGVVGGGKEEEDRADEVKGGEEERMVRGGRGLWGRLCLLMGR